MAPQKKLKRLFFGKWHWLYEDIFGCARAQIGTQKFSVCLVSTEFWA